MSSSSSGLRWILGITRKIRNAIVLIVKLGQEEGAEKVVQMLSTFIDYEMATPFSFPVLRRVTVNLTALCFMKE